jgi:hypothetical protein
MPGATLVTLAAAPALVAFRPFLEPLRLWDHWPWLIVPLCFAVSLVYKCVRVQAMKRVPVEALVATFWVLAGMSAAAAALLLIVGFVSR